MSPSTRLIDDVQMDTDGEYRLGRLAAFVRATRVPPIPGSTEIPKADEADEALTKA